MEDWINDDIYLLSRDTRAMGISKRGIMTTKVKVCSRYSVDALAIVVSTKLVRLMDVISSTQERRLLKYSKNFICERI